MTQIKASKWILGLLLIGTFALPALAGDWIAGDDFEDYPVERLRGEWKSSSQVAIADTADMAHGGTHYARIPANPDGASKTLYSTHRVKPYALPTSGVVQLDFYTHTATQKRNGLSHAEIRVGTAGEIAKVVFTADGKLLVVSNGRQARTGINWNATSLLDKWNQHTLIFDLNNSTLNYFFNGENVIRDRKVSTFNGLGELDFRAIMTKGEFRVDDIEWQIIK